MNLMITGYPVWPAVYEIRCPFYDDYKRRLSALFLRNNTLSLSF